jgi:hypothetical protein
MTPKQCCVTCGRTLRYWHSGEETKGLVTDTIQQWEALKRSADVDVGIAPCGKSRGKDSEDFFTQAVLYVGMAGEQIQGPRKGRGGRFMAVNSFNRLPSYI